jgi:translation initiation factor IF-2
MSDVTVTEFAKVLKVPVERLLVQLDEAGIQVAGAEDTISEDAKLELLTHLRRAHGRKDPGASAPRKITLKRKSQSELRLAAGQGRSRTVAVEVRRKRTYIKRDALQEEARQQQEELDAKRHAEEAQQEEARRQEEEQRAEEERRVKAAAENDAAEILRQAEEAARKREAAEDAQRTVDEERRKAENSEKAQAAEKAAKPDKGAGKPRPTRTLHVAEGASARRRKKRVRRRPVQVSVDSQHGFERPTAPVIREVEIAETITVGVLAL